MTHTLKLIVGMAVGFGAAIAIFGWREQSWRWIVGTVVVFLVLTRFGVGRFGRARRPQ